MKLTTHQFFRPKSRFTVGISMSSLRRILSSRANGARSTGPKTPEGKHRSAANATRHGLLSDCVVLPGESRDAFDALLAQHVERLDPADGVEFGMIEELAASYWRLRRSWAIENQILAEGLATQPAGDDVARFNVSVRESPAGTGAPGPQLGSGLSLSGCPMVRQELAKGRRNNNLVE